MFLANLPLWLSAILIVGVPTLLAMLGPFAVRRFVSLKNLGANNEVAGFQFATVGVTYAVLLAFAVFVVWEKFSDAEANVAKRRARRSTSTDWRKVSMGSPDRRFAMD
jgi:hypothetical protein